MYTLIKHNLIGSIFRCRIVLPTLLMGGSKIWQGRTNRQNTGFTHRHSRHVPMIARPGGPKHNEIFHIFVILWAIYNSKRTKTSEDIDQINITNNMEKMTTISVFHLFMYGIRFIFSVLCHSRLTDTRSQSCRQKLVVFQTSHQQKESKGLTNICRGTCCVDRGEVSLQWWKQV